jgi:dihydroceramidase
MNSHKLGERGLGPKLPYLALINLGFASSLFHSSLKYSTQMCDEFSMLIATFIVFYRLLSFSQTMVAPRTLLVGLCALMLFVVVAQFSTGESTVQQIVFTGMAYWLWHVCFKLIGNVDVEEAVKNKMKWMAISGIGRPSSKFPINEILGGYVTAVDLIYHSVLHHRTCMLGNRLLRL